MVMVNLYSVLMDPEYWGGPETFCPERFLNPDGSSRKEERLIPFGKGKQKDRKTSPIELPMSFKPFQLLLFRV